MKATHAAHITGDNRAEVMKKNEVKFILDFHTWFDSLRQRFY